MRIRVTLLAVFAGLAVLIGVAAPAVGAHSDPALISALDEDGRYLEETDAAIGAAIDRANPDGIAFAWLSQNGDGRVATSLADDYVEDLRELDSRYHTVIVLTAEGFGAFSDIYTQEELDTALDASFNSFRANNPGQGLDTFVESLNGSLTTSTTTPASSGESSSGGGLGFGSILAGFAVIGGAFFGIRAWINSRRRKKQAIVDMEEDRAEIREQLKNNADRVISLGDKVIAKGDQELISLYEEASASYQEVSLNVETASTAEEVDDLDDRIDQAEWQFEVIEARLDGRPTPPPPEDLDAPETTNAPPPPSAPGRGAPSPAPSEPPVATSPRTGRRYPRTSGTRRSRSGGLGGLGGGLGSILGSIILGGGLGGGRSRRSQRRSGGIGMGRGGIGTGSIRTRQRGGGSLGGGLGGGVLRRGGNSRRSQPRSKTRSSRRSGGGRSFGRSRKSGSSGGRSF